MVRASKTVPQREGSAIETTRAVILGKALALFAARGYDYVSMRELAREVGLTPASLYHHFRDKQSLYVQVLEHVYASMSSQFMETLADFSPPKARLRQYISDFCRFARDNIDFIRLVKREQLDCDKQRLQLLHERFLDRQLASCAQLIGGIRPDLDPIYAALAMHGMVLHHYESAAGYRGRNGWTTIHDDPDRLAQFVIALFSLD